MSLHLIENNQFIFLPLLFRYVFFSRLHRPFSFIYIFFVVIIDGGDGCVVLLCFVLWRVRSVRVLEHTIIQYVWCVCTHCIVYTYQTTVNRRYLGVSNRAATLL